MTDWFVTRHSGAIQWARDRGINAKAIEHFEPDVVTPGDRVIGTLPVNLAAEVCARDGRYLHLSLDVPQDLRGKDLDAAQMEACGARLEEFFVERRTSDGT